MSGWSGVSLTCYGEVGDVANKSTRKLWGNWSQWNLSLLKDAETVACVVSSRLLETDAGRCSAAMDVDTNDSVPGINAVDLALNGVVKAEDLQTAIINKVLIIIAYYCYGRRLVLTLTSVTCSSVRLYEVPAH